MPRADAQALLSQVLAVLEEYRQHLPITLRQLFYRLVGTRGYEKTEQGYKRLGELLNRARRAKLVPFGAIRDDGVMARPAPGWASVDDFMGAVQHNIDGFTLDRQQGQRRRLILMCEAAGMVPQLERVAHPYGIEVMSSGGFDSTTAKHDLACKIAHLAQSHEVEVEILHIGDHDPSGVHVFQSLAEDVFAFAETMFGVVEFTRLAVTPEQAVDLRLPTAPAKETDRRRFDGIGGDANATVQAEAIPPDLLAEIVEAAIAARVDHQALAEVIEAEKDAKAELMRAFGRLRP